MLSLMRSKNSKAGLIRRPSKISKIALTLFTFSCLSAVALAYEPSAMNSNAGRAVVAEDKAKEDKNKGDEKTSSAKVEGKDLGEMVKVVESLEERIRSLEAKLAKMEAAATPSETVAGPPTPLKAEEVAEVKKEVAAIQEE